MLIKIGLAGNPNSGKTTIFNLLAGAREKIGNWPGTTVEKKEGSFSTSQNEYLVFDLPGTYSLSSYSMDERVAGDFLIAQNPSLVVCVVDSSNLERNLYLSVQLIELGRNVLLDLNMMDAASRAGLKIDSQKLARVLGVPFVETVATRSNCRDELIHSIESNFSNNPHTLHIDYGRLEPFVEEIMAALAFAQDCNIPEHMLRGLSVRILEHAGEHQAFGLESGVPWEMIDKIIERARKVSGVEDLESYIVEKRYAYVRGLTMECVERHMTLEEKLTVSDHIDRVVTNRYLGFPLFLAMMYILFALVFKVGDPLVDLLDSFVGLIGGGVGHGMAALGLPEWLRALTVDGIISGVGGVLVFLPYICLLFFGVSFLEDSGVLARAAFIMDKIMHTLGLHGKSFIPVILGFGCNVPAIMASRILDSEKDRILTILVLPLISCSARLPVYTLFTAAFFPESRGLILFSLYCIGLLLAIAMAKIFKAAFFDSETCPLIIELPPYRMPVIRNVVSGMWVRALMFVQKAGVIILPATVVVWVLASMPWGVQYASCDSWLGQIGSYVAVVFEPAGFGFWQAAVALIFGIVAKEIVVGTLGTLYGVAESGLDVVLQSHFTAVSAYSFMLMTLLYFPCIAAFAAIVREAGWKWALVAAGYTTVLGWLVSVVFFQTASLFF